MPPDQGDPLGTVRYLDLAGVRRDVEARVRRGEGFRPPDSSVAVFRREGGYFLLPHDHNSNGLTVLRWELEPLALDRDASPDDLGAWLIDALTRPCSLFDDVPKRTRQPLVRRTKVSSWRELLRTSEDASINRRVTSYSATAWMRDVSRLDGSEIPAPDGHAKLEDPTAAQLGQAAIRTFNILENYR